MTTNENAEDVKARLRALLDDLAVTMDYRTFADRVKYVAGPRPRPAVMVELYKPNGKYYTEESWRIPKGAIGPYDMRNSPDFRRISDGPVLIPAQEPWGFPYLIMPE